MPSNAPTNTTSSGTFPSRRFCDVSAKSSVKMNRLTVYLTTSLRSSVVAMMRGVICALATWIATSNDPNVNTTNDRVAVTTSCRVASAPLTDNDSRFHSNHGSIQRNNLVSRKAKGMVTKGTTQSEDLA